MGLIFPSFSIFSTLANLSLPTVLFWQKTKSPIQESILSSSFVTMEGAYLLPPIVVNFYFKNLVLEIVSFLLLVSSTPPHSSSSSSPLPWIFPMFKKVYFLQSLKKKKFLMISFHLAALIIFLLHSQLLFLSLIFLWTIIGHFCPNSSIKSIPLNCLVPYNSPK